MHRTLRSAGLALGLPLILASISSCVDTRPTSPALARVAHFSHAILPDVRISEIHYDNAGTDTGEAIEVSAPAGFDLTGWRVVLYNGNGGGSYNSTVLSGTAPTSCGDRGVITLTYASNGIQNGSPDGVALVDPGNLVVEFLSYEGVFSATNEAANGQGSTDIGVSETEATPVGSSLKRLPDGTWAAATPSNFGACNDHGDGEQPGAVAEIAVSPASAAVEPGQQVAFTARAFDANGIEIRGTSVTWASSNTAVATVAASGVASAVAVGSASISAASANGITGSASLTVTTATFEAHINEIHYDNAGADTGEAIEVEGPAGQSLAGWSLVLYNGSNGQVYNTRALTGTFENQCAGRGTLSFAYSGIVQNGSPDGVALVTPSGQVKEFLSYEGTFTATGGPASGLMSVNIGVDEDGDEPAGKSLQRGADGVWYGPQTASFGACNVKEVIPNRVQITGRTASDPALPVGFEDQLFGTLVNGQGDAEASTFSWSSDTPEIAIVSDARGVIRGVSAGTAIIRATAADGTTGTIALPVAVAVPGSAEYAGNTEFGIPRDADASDDFIIVRPQYTSSFNKLRGIPNWASYNIDQTHFGAEARCDCFTFDPELPADYARYTTADYTGSGAFHGFGIDRGHLVRSFDRESGSLDNAVTYYFSNIVPQTADNNQGPWAAFETYLGNFARFENKEVYVIAGAAGGTATLKNEGRITLPAHMWKVAVIADRDRGLAHVGGHADVQVLAVIMPNVSGIRNVPWESYLTTVDAVEGLSGYNVLHLLSDELEGLLESGLFRAQAVVDRLLAAGTLNAGTANSLTVKLRGAALMLEQGDRATAAERLKALLNEVAAMERSGRMNGTDADTIRAIVAPVLAG